MVAVHEIGNIGLNALHPRKITQPILAYEHGHGADPGFLAVSP